MTVRGIPSHWWGHYRTPLISNANWACHKCTVTHSKGCDVFVILPSELLWVVGWFLVVVVCLSGAGEWVLADGSQQSSLAFPKTVCGFLLLCFFFCYSCRCYFTYFITIFMYVHLGCLCVCECAFCCCAHLSLLCLCPCHLLLPLPSCFPPQPLFASFWTALSDGLGCRRWMWLFLHKPTVLFSYC